MLNVSSARWTQTCSAVFIGLSPVARSSAISSVCYFLSLVHESQSVFISSSFCCCFKGDSVFWIDRNWWRLPRSISSWSINIKKTGSEIKNTHPALIWNETWEQKTKEVCVWEEGCWSDRSDSWLKTDNRLEWNVKIWCFIWLFLWEHEECLVSRTEEDATLDTIHTRL